MLFESLFLTKAKSSVHKCNSRRSSSQRYRYTRCDVASVGDASAAEYHGHPTVHMCQTCVNEREHETSGRCRESRASSVYRVVSSAERLITPSAL